MLIRWRIKLIKTISTLIKIIIHPRQTSHEILKEESIRSALLVVLGNALILAIPSLYTYLAKTYPPDSATFKLIIEVWGKFGILPFIQVPVESYRLIQAVFSIPMAFAIWILMAGSARLLSILFHGKVTYKQYLCLFAYSFFAFFAIEFIIDILFVDIFNNFVYSALRMEYGVLAAQIAAWFPLIVYPIVLLLGGIYNGIVTQEHEHYSLIKTALVIITTAFWPIMLITFLVRW